MTKEMWDDIVRCAHAAINSDDSMSQSSAMAGERVLDWIMSQEWEDDA